MCMYYQNNENSQTWLFLSLDAFTPFVSLYISGKFSQLLVWNKQWI